VADKVLGSEHHVTDITVKTCFVPVLTEENTNHIINLEGLDLNLNLDVNLVDYVQTEEVQNMDRCFLKTLNSQNKFN